MLVIEINEKINYDEIIDYNNDISILIELAKNGNANSICKLGIMWYDGKFEDNKRTKKMQMLMAEYLFSHILENGEANYYLYLIYKYYIKIKNDEELLEILKKSSSCILGKLELLKIKLLGDKESKKEAYKIINEMQEIDIKEDYENYLEDFFLKKGYNNPIWIRNSHESRIQGLKGFEEIASSRLIEKYIDFFTYKDSNMTCFIGNLWRNPNLTEDFIERHFEKMIYYRSSWVTNKSFHPRLLPKFVVEFLGNNEREMKNLKSSMKNSLGQNLDEKMLEEIMLEQNDLRNYSNHPSLTPEIVFKSVIRSKIWDINKLAIHPNFTEEKINEINKLYDIYTGINPNKITYDVRKETLEKFKKDYFK